VENRQANKLTKDPEVEVRQRNVWSWNWSKPYDKEEAAVCQLHFISIEKEINLPSEKWTETGQTHDNGGHIEEIQNAWLRGKAYRAQTKINKKSYTKTSGKDGHKESIRKVREFLTREDNARQMPGKSDTAKNENREMVTEVCALKNLYLKFKAENEGLNISFATFCRARPKHVVIVKYAARVSCLCTKHQNLRWSLKKTWGTSNTSPDSFHTVKFKECKLWWWQTKNQVNRDRKR